jgi:hypothetical protein
MEVDVEDLWPSTWWSFGHDGGPGSPIVDCSGPPEAQAPVLIPSMSLEPATRATDSFTQLVEWWLEMFDLGVYTSREGRPTRHAALMPDTLIKRRVL